jgi:amino acid permease
VQLCSFGAGHFAENEPRSKFADFQAPDKEADIWKIIKSACFVLVAFSFTINLFPIYSALKIKSNENCKTTITISVGLVGSLYAFLSVTCVLLFGA